jgi:hypothetical protein
MWQIIETGIDRLRDFKIHQALSDRGADERVPHRPALRRMACANDIAVRQRSLTRRDHLGSGRVPSIPADRAH